MPVIAELTTPPGKGRLLLPAIHVLALWNLAVAHPALGHVSPHVEFFIIRNAGAASLIALALVVCLLLPLVTVAGLILLERLSHGLMITCYRLLLLLLFSALFLRILSFLHPHVPGLLLITLCLIVASLAVTACVRIPWARDTLTFTGMAIIIVPLYFLLFTPVTSLVLPAAVDDTGNETAAADRLHLPHIIMIVFDELPLVSLLDSDAAIDPVRYPNFARLAAQAYWFRNATTNAANTAEAISALLSGRIARPAENRQEDRENLFTWLAGSYRLQVVEPLSRNCPDRLCPRAENISARQVCSAVADLGVLYLHNLLPGNMKTMLPDIENRWHHFGGETAFCRNLQRDQTAPPADRRRDIFVDFTATLADMDGPTLAYLHSMLPHGPWEYMPDGKKAAKHIDRYLRHLMQTAYADHLLGGVLGQLEQEKLLDRSLVIVTADHGISFWPQYQVRNTRYLDSYRDIMSIPLLVKLPGQDMAVVSERNIELIDIVPAIADILDLPLRWQVDGSSFIDEEIQRPFKSFIDSQGKLHRQAAFISPFSPSLKYKIDRFGERSNWRLLVDRDL